MLLQRFKLTTEKFRELFSRYRKSPNGTWKDYYFEIRAYFEGWLNKLKIDSFDGLKNLMVADQMKKRCSPECKENYLDIWEELISPEMKPERPPKIEYSHQVPNERSPLRCYGCGKQGVIKSRCPICNLNASQRTDVATNHINVYTAQTRSPRLTLIDITFCGIKGRETTLAIGLADRPKCEEYLVAAVAEWYRYQTVAGLVTSSSPVPLKTRRVGQRCTLNLSRAEMSSRWCGVVVRRGGASSGVVHVT
ncbi:uncharacterized protein TNCV_2732681 [Trichonephila clavipes]|nr:uncharacterized protein TNCV_2732681 [Trichonephila clavipes]